MLAAWQQWWECRASLSGALLVWYEIRNEGQRNWWGRAGPKVDGLKGRNGSRGWVGVLVLCLYGCVLVRLLGKWPAARLHTAGCG